MLTDDQRAILENAADLNKRIKNFSRNWRTLGDRETLEALSTLCDVVAIQQEMIERLYDRVGRIQFPDCDDD